MDLLLPPSCAGCGRYGTALCGRCVAAFRPAGRGDDRFIIADPGVVLGESLELAFAAFTHAGTLRRAIQRLKYGGSARLADPLAKAAAPRLRALVEVIGSAPLVPVPVHDDRRRTRGYNQAELLARALGRVVGLPVLDVLRRSRSTGRQHTLNRMARLANLRDAFACTEDRFGGMPPKRVILVDDILTTGATLEACALVLRAAGVLRVAGLAIAREV